MIHLGIRAAERLFGLSRMARKYFGSLLVTGIMASIPFEDIFIKIYLATKSYLKKNNTWGITDLVLFGELC